MLLPGAAADAAAAEVGAASAAAVAGHDRRPLCQTENR